ncbi:MAG: glutamate racemase, partial [Glaciecola sp.]
SAYAPYGDQPINTIIERVHILTQRLIAQDCDLIVVACNTATVNVINELRAEYDALFVGVEPGIKPAVAASNNRNVGVMVTQRTADSARFQTFANSFLNQANIHIQACPGLAECVEKLELAKPTTKQLVSRYVNSLLLKKVDTIVLGCTHYPFLQPLIDLVTPDGIRIINTNIAVAQQVERMVKPFEDNQEQPTGSFVVYTSGNQEKCQAAVSKLLTFPVTVYPLLSHS